MIGRRRFWILCFALAALVGCAPKPLEIAPEIAAPPVTSSRVNFKKVQIMSKPAGAHIEVNQNYVGNAPITVEFASTGRNFTMDTTIRALPTSSVLAVQYIQSKFFPRNAVIPDKIIFDMGLQRPVY
jgi:hypothetical protein